LISDSVATIRVDILAFKQAIRDFGGQNEECNDSENSYAHNKPVLDRVGEASEQPRAEANEGIHKKTMMWHDMVAWHADMQATAGVDATSMMRTRPPTSVY
jgi:hypothetical protein